MKPLKNDPYAGRRKHMVRSQIQARGVSDPKVLEALDTVPRHMFVSEALHDQAYQDFPLPIGEGQTISQPYIVAEMTQALNLTKEDRVLEIGTGCGYQTAILAQLAYKVYTIERIRSLFIGARKTFDELGFHNIVARCADGTLGWQDEAPFDAIIVTAGAPITPIALISQLAMGGRLIIPVGDQSVQSLKKIVRDEHGIHESDLGACRFVKLVGEQGWRD
ncbi:protein-L-isoaspartate(D-aspartate) O-methyltransferase [Desulfatibacillum alkenivorans]|nr:protein-L-isoaspartate(D-aspartate) O-methyltransferase [Desulfatibacillum alkenivorans]